VVFIGDAPPVMMVVEVGSSGIPSENMPFRNRWAILAASRVVTKAIVCCLAPVFAAGLQTSLSRAEGRSKGYLNEMRIMACVTAQIPCAHA
jgi:hypothetical protein